MFKQVIIVRKDLGMTCGKIAGQVAHAAIMAMEKTIRYNPSWVTDWKDEDGQIKVVLKVNSYSELNDYFIHTINARLPVVKVHDAGKTQIESNTVTCVVLTVIGYSFAYLHRLHFLASSFCIQSNY
jgi:PTH2 family peptidyl-tRNA hydrolase